MVQRFILFNLQIYTYNVHEHPIDNLMLSTTKLTLYRHYTMYIVQYIHMKLKSCDVLCNLYMYAYVLPTYNFHTEKKTDF